MCITSITKDADGMYLVSKPGATYSVSTLEKAIEKVDDIRSNVGAVVMPPEIFDEIVEMAAATV